MGERAGLRAVLRGRVQMVGFRYFAWRTAERHGVDGWVCNRRDGAVEVEAVGPRDQVEAFVQHLREGPPGALITDVDIQWIDPPPSHHGFSIAHSD